MNSITNSNSSACDNILVDISGLCNSNDVTDVLNVYPYWMQMYVPEVLTIPPLKPDIETLNAVIISVDIIRSDVIKTPRSYSNTTPPVAMPNLEGKLLTGRKIIIEGNLCQKIEYTANVGEQSVHSAHFYVPFSSYIVVPEEIVFHNSDGTTTTVDSLDVNYEVNACVEDVSVCTIDERTILKKVTLLLYAVPVQSC